MLCHLPVGKPLLPARLKQDHLRAESQGPGHWAVFRPLEFRAQKGTAWNPKSRAEAGGSPCPLSTCVQSRHHDPAGPLAGRPIAGPGARPRGSHLRNLERITDPFEPQFLHVQNGDDNSSIPRVGLLLELDETTRVMPGTHRPCWKRAHPSGQNDTDHVSAAKEPFWMWVCPHPHGGEQV